MGSLTERLTCIHLASDSVTIPGVNGHFDASAAFTRALPPRMLNIAAITHAAIHNPLCLLTSLYLERLRGKNLKPDKASIRALLEGRPNPFRSTN
jgi:hypothetical protein